MTTLSPKVWRIERPGIAAGTKILCIDDDAFVADLLRCALTNVGYTVQVVTSGTEALARVHDDPPDIVILEALLPDIDGFLLCRYLRTELGVRVIMLSACHADEDVIRGLKSGADDYLIKPVSIRVLLCKLQVVLRVRTPGAAAIR